MTEPAKDEAELIDQEDTHAGLFWVRASDSYWQTATPGEACAEIKRLRAENARLRKALKKLLDHSERNTCQHEETHRGGFLWEICDGCGAKWADDMGGKTEWKDPPEWVAARAALAGEVKP